ncbi:hypothetical protein Syun_012123 [Stephania yunnanensis]|uniref:Uncharacterized protein n=1 Tax=Stephania yunnanensis TaxID=152371 RepID=A0AAP0JYU7_9MAGN
MRAFGLGPFSESEMEPVEEVQEEWTQLEFYGAAGRLIEGNASKIDSSSKQHKIELEYRSMVNGVIRMIEVGYKGCAGRGNSASSGLGIFDAFFASLSMILVSELGEQETDEVYAQITLTPKWM